VKRLLVGLTFVGLMLLGPWIVFAQEPTPGPVDWLGLAAEAIIALTPILAPVLVMLIRDNVLARVPVFLMPMVAAGLATALQYVVAIGGGVDLPIWKMAALAFLAIVLRDIGASIQKHRFGPDARLVRP